MYPNLYYAFKDLFGVGEHFKFLRFINSFGFFVALSFLAAAITLAKELLRKEKAGLLQAKEETIIVGKPASISELLLNFILGFLLGFKIIGLFISNSPLTANPQDFIMSTEGSWPAGILLGILFAGLKWWEKNKQKLPEPQERRIRIWPHDRVGDLAIYAALFGFAGAKVFNSLETWNDFVRNPIESLFSFSGLTFYGGLICAALAIWYYAKKNGIPFWHLNDAAAPGPVGGVECRGQQRKQREGAQEQAHGRGSCQSQPEDGGFEGMALRLKQAASPTVHRRNVEENKREDDQGAHALQEEAELAAAIAFLDVVLHALVPQQIEPDSGLGRKGGKDEE